MFRFVNCRNNLTVGNILFVAVFVCCRRFSEASYCTYYKQCGYTEYYSHKSYYYASCGFLGWDRCSRSRYRATGYTAYRMCSYSDCCYGYTGSLCKQVVCHGQTTCPNGGTCTSPDTCSCATGFSGSNCADTNECSSGTDSCQHVCTNTHGSYICSCYQGYTLNSDKETCADINECQSSNGGCSQNCRNLPGSYSCYCDTGYTLDSDQKTCIDINECLSNKSGCSHNCKNLVGSYECYCNSGYILDSDKTTCIDNNECFDNNGGCDQICTNVIGSFECSCNTGYDKNITTAQCIDVNECQFNNGNCTQHCRNLLGSYECYCNNGYKLDIDMETCLEIDECLMNKGGCSQNCRNLAGSHECYCNTGYTLDADKKTCLDVDDCISIDCLHNGSCVDSVNSYSCKCETGYEGDHCESDVNECLFVNGGCEDQCINTNGSYYCECTDNTYLEDDGVSCRGDSNKPNVFEKYKINQRLLPRGCMYIKLASCEGFGNGHEIILSSTDLWYQVKTDNEIYFTYGIVFAEVNEFSIPVSITGAVVISRTNHFQYTIGSTAYTITEGIALTDRHTADCLQFSTTPKDIFDFVNSGSFLGTILGKLNLPDWLQFTKSGVGLIDVSDLKTDLISGRSIDILHECRGAPVFSDRLYSVFRFGTEISFSIYGNRVDLPRPLKGNKFCLIIDICQSNGGTVFLMIPPESRNLLDKVDFFSLLYKNQGLRFRPIGLGLSLVRDINVHYKTNELELWNGDQLFKYPVFPSSSVWLGTNIEWKSTSKNLNISVYGETEIFLAVPNIQTLPLGIFVDEWGGLIHFKNITATPTIGFELFDKEHKLTFPDMAVATLDIFWSIGGTDNRIWCGDGANPPGIFLSFFLDVNPFRNVPVIKDWLLSANLQVRAFVTTQETFTLTQSLDVENELLDIEKMVQRFLSLLNRFIADLGDNLSGTVSTLLSNLKTSLLSLSLTVDSLNGKTELSQMFDVGKTLWTEYSNNSKKIVDALFNELEFSSMELRHDLTYLVDAETARIGRSIDLFISKIRDEVFSLQKSYTGFGFSMSFFVKIFGLEFSLMDVEIVYSVDNIGRCSKYKKLYELLRGQEALRVLCRRTLGLNLGYFLRFEGSYFLSIAIGRVDVLAHSHVHVNILGLKVSGDLFISKNILQVSVQGNIWNIFFATVKLTTNPNKPWNQLSFNVKGTFIAKSDETDFQLSYLDGLRLFANRVAENANKRLTDVQNALSSAQMLLGVVQEKLTDAQNYIHKCNSAFDEAVNSLENAKIKLEKAKIPYKIALERLRQAQRNVDNLCKIRRCGRLCIPGIRCRWCGGWIKYPCCGWTSCMFSIPDVFCIAANAMCYTVRGIAYAALEAAKIVIRTPMIVYDAAELAVSVVQLAVDKSRAVLWIAEGALEIAKFQLETTKGILELAKFAVENVKITVNAALHVFDFIVQYGIQSVIDVKNCGFEFQMSTSDLSFFDISCEVKAFGLGWTTFKFAFDFKHPVTGIWRVAKSTVNFLLKSVSNVFGKRKRREIAFTSMTVFHNALHRYKREAVNETDFETIYLNETLFQDIIYDSTDFYDSKTERIILFEKNCKDFQKVTFFLLESVESLRLMVNETASMYDHVKTNTEIIYNITTNTTMENKVAEDFGVSPEYALTDYNITSDELQSVTEDMKTSFENDPMMVETKNTTDIALEMINYGIKEAETIQIVPYWLLAMENETRTYFNISDCYDFRDCVLYAFFTLHDLFTDDSLENSDLNRNLSSSLEDSFLDLFLNISRSPIEVYRIMLEISSTLSELNDKNQYCSTPPRITTLMKDQTILVGSQLSLACKAVGDPEPVIWWFYNGTYMNRMNESKIQYNNATMDHTGIYRCKAGNIITNVSSVAFVKVKECPPGTFFDAVSCIECAKGEYQEKWNQRYCVQCPAGYTTDSSGSYNRSYCTVTDLLVKVLCSSAAVIVIFVVVVVCLHARKIRQTRKMKTSTKYVGDIYKPPCIKYNQTPDVLKNKTNSSSFQDTSSEKET